MNRLFNRSTLLAVALTLVATGCPLFVNLDVPPVDGDKNTVWPISGTTTPDGPLASPFGPRIIASEANRYDFHRGIDIPVAFGSPVHAVADGTVRIAGTDEAYSGTLVQLSHFDSGINYFSNYLHLSSALVIEGTTVNKGDVIGFSGVSESGFPHLHFEIRQGGLLQRHAINPFTRLPYIDRRSPTVRIDEVNVETPGAPDVTVTVELPRGSARQELDFNEIEVSVWVASGDSMTLVDEHSVNLEEWNFAHTPEPPEDANQFLDDPMFNGVMIEPAHFSSSSSGYTVKFTFFDLVGTADAAELMVTATARDVDGNSRQAVWPEEGK